MSNVKIVKDFVETHIRNSQEIADQAIRVEANISMQIDSILEIDDEFDNLYLKRDQNNLWTELFFTNPAVMIETLKMLQERYPSYIFVFQSKVGKNDEQLIIKSVS